MIAPWLISGLAPQGSPIEAVGAKVTRPTCATRAFQKYGAIDLFRKAPCPADSFFFAYPSFSSIDLKKQLTCHVRRQTDSMDDMAGPGRIQEDNDRHRPTLTVHDVSLALSAAGVPRFERQIKRYCETGFLDAKKVPGPKMVRRPAWIGFWALDAKRLMPDDGHFCRLVVSRHEGPVCLQAVEIRRECRHEPWKKPATAAASVRRA